ncbi:MAG: hypothetical protein KUG66_01335 [Gammaproteobacteria bacterium]|nr:hypothetical protein [Gammaproteobacteria bacterium]
MGRKNILIIGAFLLLTGCASWQTNYQAMGKYESQSDISGRNVSFDNTDVYIQEYPEGFQFKDGVISVDSESGMKIIGEARIEFKASSQLVNLILFVGTAGAAAPVIVANMFYVPKMTKDDMVAELKTKANEVGGNSVIGVKLPSGNNKREGASGIIVFIPEKI